MALADLCGAESVSLSRKLVRSRAGVNLLRKIASAGRRMSEFY
jgi:hypothetical protein